MTFGTFRSSVRICHNTVKKCKNIAENYFVFIIKYRNLFILTAFACKLRTFCSGEFKDEICNFSNFANLQK